MALTGLAERPAETVHPAAGALTTAVLAAPPLLDLPGALGTQQGAVAEGAEQVWWDLLDKPLSAATEGMGWPVASLEPPSFTAAEGAVAQRQASRAAREVLEVALRGQMVLAPCPERTDLVVAAARRLLEPVRTADQASSSYPGQPPLALAPEEPSRFQVPTPYTLSQPPVLS